MDYGGDHSHGREPRVAQLQMKLVKSGNDGEWDIQEFSSYPDEKGD